MSNENFAQDFYCRACGSTTAINIPNIGKVRCMGCLQLYKELKEFDGWVRAPWGASIPVKAVKE